MAVLRPSLPRPLPDRHSTDGVRRRKVTAVGRDDAVLLAQRFEAARGHLRAVAYQMLGSLAEAEDAVQESWLRLARSDVSGVQNLTGWLTTVVGRICLDVLRARRVRREESLDAR